MGGEVGPEVAHFYGKKHIFGVKSFFLRFIFFWHNHPNMRCITLRDTYCYLRKIFFDHQSHVCLSFYHEKREMTHQKNWFNFFGSIQFLVFWNIRDLRLNRKIIPLFRHSEFWRNVLETTIDKFFYLFELYNLKTLLKGFRVDFFVLNLSIVVSKKFLQTSLCLKSGIVFLFSRKSRMFQKTRRKQTNSNFQIRFMSPGAI